MIRIEMKNRYMQNYMIEKLLKRFEKFNKISFFVINKRTKDFKIAEPEIYIAIEKSTRKEIKKMNLRLSLDFNDLCKTKILNKTKEKQIVSLLKKRNKRK